MSVHRPIGRRPELVPVDFDPFAPAVDRVVLPLTEPQQEVWTAAQMSPAASAAYNQCFPLRLTGRFSVESMRNAIHRVAERHDALRLTFADDGSGQRLGSAADIRVSEIDLSTLAPDARRDALSDLLVRESREPFDLATGPLARVHIVRESEESHVLVITAHHLICDGWSSGVLLQDLAALYTADRYGLPAHLPDVMPYGDHVRQSSGHGAEAAESEQYWLRVFADGAPVLELPTDRQRPVMRTFSGSHERLTLDAALYRDVKALGARHGCTLYVTLLAAWQVLLARLSGQNDLVVGIPVAEQASLDNGHLVGHFVHMLPLRTTIDLSASFAQQLLAARARLVEGHEHRAMTCGQLIRQLDLPRQTSHVPLVAVVFNVDRPTAPPAFEGLALEPLAAPRSGYNFDAGLDIADTGADLRIEFNYNSDQFDAATIRRWLAYYCTLLESAAADSAVPVNRLRMLSVDEHRALAAQGAAQAVFATERLHHTFEEVVRRTPAAVAIRVDDQSVSYDDLNRQANRLAHHLRTLGVGPGALVGICLERSLEMIVAILAVLKAGGAYVPCEPESPTERIREMMDDARPRAVIASAATRRHFEARTATVVLVDADGGTIANQPEVNLAIAASAEDLAYVIFTSGSTGRPKGVEVSHGNVSRLFSATDAQFHFGPADVWTLFHSVAFDFSVWEIWGALLYGGRLIVVPHRVSRAPDAFLDLVRRERVTVLNQTPSAFRQLIEADRTASGATPDLRVVIFGGEALDLTTLAPWVERHGDQQPALVNMYGITETTVHVTYRRILIEDIRAGARSPIGAPLRDLDLHLLAPDTDELVPVGVPGELCVGGAGVARGYLNRPDLSRARFVPNPFGTLPGGRLYRSGDLARRRADGDLEYLGRIDQQVKVRGFRIELGEIEATLAGHHAVRECAVVLATSSGGEPRLIAYVAAHTHAAVQPGELLAHLRTRLPEYMIPAAFVFLDALPLTANGKLDRLRLPPVEAPGAAAADPEAARTPTEQALATIWQEVLERSGIGTNDSFFDLGGHSMLAVKIARRASEVFAIELPVTSLFRAPTIAQLADAIDALRLTALRRSTDSEGREVIEL